MTNGRLSFVGAGALLTVLAAAGCSGPGNAGAQASSTPSMAGARGNTAAAQVAGDPARCHTVDLSARLVTSTPKSTHEQTTALLVFSNTGSRACRLHGFPGVDLVGPDSQPYCPRYSLPRTTTDPTDVDLAPGGLAHAVITYLPGDWTPTSLSTTPPDETTQLTVAWPAGIGVLRQDGATHPGTFIGPVLAGAQ